MPIRSSSAGEVERLVAQLRDPRSAIREGAVARLRVIGTRAINRVVALIAAPTETASTRACALRALEGSEDPRVRAATLLAVQDVDESVATAAVTNLRAWVMHEEGLAVLDTLAALAVDRGRPPSVRSAALDALAQLPPQLVQPLITQLATEVDTGLPDDPFAARGWLADHEQTPLSLLHDFIIHTQGRERTETSDRQRDEWQVTRGAAHALLARRGSRVALYALRDEFDSAQGQLPLDFLTAVTAIGDPDCLEPMARAWSATPDEDWWRSRLADAALDVMNRLRLTGRSAVVKRVRAKYPGFL